MTIRTSGASNYAPEKEETPRANEGSVSEPIQKETNMSTIIAETTDNRELTDADIVDGQLYKLGEDSAWYKPIERRKRYLASDLKPEKLEKIRNKPDGIHAIECPFGDAIDAEGNKIKFATFPNGSYLGANYLFRQDGITYVGRGHYWSDAIEEVDGVEYVNFEYSVDNLPCPVHEWCRGHRVTDLEGYETTGVDELFHLGDNDAIFTFDDGDTIDMMRTTDAEGHEAVSISITLDRDFDRADLRQFAQELLRATDAIVAYGARMEAN